MPSPILPDMSGLIKIVKGRISTLLVYAKWNKVERWVVRGEELNSHQPLTILYTGTLINKNIFINLVFGDNYTEQCLGFLHLWQIFERNNRKYGDCSIVVHDSLKIFRRYFLRKNYFYIPTMVRGKIVLPGEFSRIINNSSTKSDLRIIKRNQLSFIIKNDIVSFDKFYYDMHVPFITSRHGKLAYLNTYDDLRRKFKKCFLIFVEKDNVPIAGMMVSCSGNYGRLWVMGVEGGERIILKKGQERHYTIIHWMFYIRGVVVRLMPAALFLF